MGQPQPQPEMTGHGNSHANGPPVSRPPEGTMHWWDLV
jgi:hypothetical protein